MKASLQVFSTIKIVFQHISVLILLLSIALDNIVDGCVPEKTPWTGMCRAKCDVIKAIVVLSNCNATSLGQGSYSGDESRLTIYFKSSGVKNVTSRAFFGHSLFELFLKHSFVNFEPGSFEGLEVRLLHIKGNRNLTSLPSGAFRGVTGLEWLFLSDNDLQSVPANLFRGLTGLELLDLSNNDLQSVPANLFHGLTGLGFLYLINNKISCFPLELLHPLQSLEELKMNQKVNITGLCAQSFKDVGVNGLEVKDYKAKIDKCIVECGSSVNGLTIIESNKTCDCDSREGCLTCAGDPAQPPIPTGDPAQPPIPPTAGGVQAMKADATGGIILMVAPVMILVREFDF